MCKIFPFFRTTSHIAVPQHVYSDQTIHSRHHNNHIHLDMQLDDIHKSQGKTKNESLFLGSR